MSSSNAHQHQEDPEDDDMSDNSDNSDNSDEVEFRFVTDDDDDYEDDGRIPSFW